MDAVVVVGAPNPVPKPEILKVVSLETKVSALPKALYKVAMLFYNHKLGCTSHLDLNCSLYSSSLHFISGIQTVARQCTMSSSEDSNNESLNNIPLTFKREYEPRSSHPVIPGSTESCLCWNSKLMKWRYLLFPKWQSPLCSMWQELRLGDVITKRITLALTLCLLKWLLCFVILGSSYWH